MPSAPSSFPDTTGPTPPGVCIDAGRLTFDDEVLFDYLSVTLAAGKWTCLLGQSGIG